MNSAQRRKDRRRHGHLLKQVDKWRTRAKTAEAAKTSLEMMISTSLINRIKYLFGRKPVI